MKRSWIERYFYCEDGDGWGAVLVVLAVVIVLCTILQGLTPPPVGMP